MKKPNYAFETKKRADRNGLPPKGAYVAEIQAVRCLTKGKDNVSMDRLELFMDIVEGEYTGRFRQVYEDQKERFGDNVSYKGIFRMSVPEEGDNNYDYLMRILQENLWCVEQSNDPYKWDWDEKKLKGKKVGISLRNRFYTFNGKDRETVEIARLETIDDVHNGKCKPVNDRDQREKHDDAEESTDGSDFTDVSKEISVPW